MGAEIQVENMSFAYKGSEWILSGLDFQVQRGEILTMIGPSGCGKSTLLQLLAGYREPSTGSIRFEFSNSNLPSLDRMMIFQNHNLFPWMSVEENILSGYRQKRGEGGSRETELKEIMERVGLTPYRNYYPHQISLGMQQRVGIARAMLTKCRILLMDEPYSSLDEIQKENGKNLLLEFHKTLTSTVILVTHNIADALALGTRTLVLGGKPTRILLDEKLPSISCTAEQIRELLKT